MIVRKNNNQTTHKSGSGYSCEEMKEVYVYIVQNKTCHLAHAHEHEHEREKDVLDVKVRRRQEGVGGVVGGRGGNKVVVVHHLVLNRVQGSRWAAHTFAAGGA